MSNSKHTPGPWYAVPSSTQRSFKVYINPSGGFTLTTITTNHRHAGQALVDGQLMAAAPTMLDALKRIEMIASCAPNDDPEAAERELTKIMEIARAAAKHAEGEPK